jgi:hypothetical protein
MDDRVKLVNLAPGIQAVCVKDNMRIKNPAGKGYIIKRVIGCIIYIDHVVGVNYVEMANRFVCDSKEDQDKKFTKLTAGQLIPMYNSGVQKGKYGLPVIAFETEKGKEVPIAVTDKDLPQN